MKPHYVQYDAQNKQFLAWSSITGEMFYLKKDSGSQELYIEKTLQIPELYGVYVRSFTIMGDELLFVSGHNNQKIIRADLETLTVKRQLSCTGTDSRNGATDENTGLLLYYNIHR